MAISDKYSTMKPDNHAPLAEAISLTKHRPALYNTFMQTVVNSLQSLTDDTTLDRIEKCRSDAALGSVLTTVYTSSLMSMLEKRLYKFAVNTMLVTINGVLFDDMKSHGKISKYNYITLSTRTLNQIIDAIITPLKLHLTSQVSEPYDSDDIETITDTITSRRFMTMATNAVTANESISDLVDNICTTVIHELVHGIQHVRQYNAGRDQLMFRSHLSDPKLRQGADDEFLALSRQQLRNPQAGKSSRWYKLYQASPSEIAAFAHNIAIKVIKSIEHLPATAYQTHVEKIRRLIETGILYHTKQHLGGRMDRSNPKEAAVINMYLKRAYQEVSLYIKHTHKVNI